MITNTFTNKVALYAAGESSSYPTYLSLGSGTSKASQSDTELVSYQVSQEVSGEVNQQVITYSIYVPYTYEDAEVTHELGLFDGSGSGNDCFMRQHTFQWYRGEDKNYHVTSFAYLKPITNSDVNLLHQSFTSELSSQMVGTDITSPAEFVMGALSFLDRCESLGTSPNDWQDSTDAVAASLNSNEELEGEYCIDLGKSGTGSPTATYSRTLASSIDCSYATKFMLYINIDSTSAYLVLKDTDCLTLKIGTDDSNYYSYSFDRNNLLVGWQSPVINISDMSVTGSPGLNQLQYLEISFETSNATDTVSSGGWGMDYWALFVPLSFDDTELDNPLTTFSFSSGYPRVTTNSVKWQGFLPKNSGNTYNYQFMGLKSGSGTSDGTLKLQNILNYRIQKDQYKQVTAEANLNIQNDKFSE